VFLAEMAAIVPWGVLEALIAPWAAAFPLATMLRIYFLQQWYNRSDPGAEETAASGLKDASRRAAFDIERVVSRGTRRPA
jgi:hypothetical protein